VNFLSLIEAKRKGKILAPEQIQKFIREFTAGKIPDYQIGRNAHGCFIFASGDFFPDFNFRECRAEFVHTRQQRLNMRVCEMRVERGPARPVFVEEKFRRIFGRMVQVVIDAARFLARRCDETNQRLFQFRLLARPGLKRGDDGDGFHNLFFNCG
jgi:hypothetical protein